MSSEYLKRAVESYAFDEEMTGRHMVFLAGPRQVGKTRLAKNWLECKECSSLYFNWDDLKTRQAYREDSRFFESAARTTGIRDPWIVFDEVHKRKGWRDVVKGAYDLFAESFRFLVTGSARLDLLRRGGDSLVGRYNLFSMMPFNLREVTGRPGNGCFLEESSIERMIERFDREFTQPVGADLVAGFEGLLRLGPFPEPFLRQNDRFCHKWHQDYRSLLVRHDLGDISRVTDLDKIETLAMLLPSRIMAPLSVASLAREVEAAHTTVKNWLEQFKRLYLAFPVTPWSKKIARGLKKEAKWYFLDWYYAPEGEARLENMAATSLLRACLALTEKGHGTYRLHYVRTLDGKEIDFLVARDNRPVLAVEVKSHDTALARPLRDRRRWWPDTPTLGVQVVNRRGVLKKDPGDTWIVSIERFLSLLE